MKTDYWTVDPFYIDLCQGITLLPNVEETMQYVVEHVCHGEVGQRRVCRCFNVVV